MGLPAYDFDSGDDCFHAFNRSDGFVVKYVKKIPGGILVTFGATALVYLLRLRWKSSEHVSEEFPAVCLHSPSRSFTTTWSASPPVARRLRFPNINRTTPAPRAEPPSEVTQG
jgi:hypothetical protein